MTKLCFKIFVGIFIGTTALGAELEQFIRSQPTSSAVSKGVMTVIMVPQRIVKKTLPAGLRLAPRLMETNGNYPVAMFIGTHTNLTSHFEGQDFVVAKKYEEATFTMTVLGPNSDTEYGYTSRITVNSIPAMLMGWALGYPKVLSEITATSNSFESVSCEQPLVQMKMATVANPDITAFRANLEYLGSQMRSTIGKTAFGFICFDLDWQFESAVLAPVTVNVSLSDAFMGKGMGGSYQSSSLDISKYGSMYLESPWKMHSFRKCD